MLKLKLHYFWPPDVKTESERNPGVGDGQGGLACYDSWGRKESDTTEQPELTEYIGYM